MSKKEILAFNRGYDDGVRDTVRQDRERLRLATGLLIREVAGIIRGDPHLCSTSGIALAVDMPHANGRCYACALVSFTGDASVAEYIAVAATISAATANDGPTC